MICNVPRWLVAAAAAIGAVFPAAHARAGKPRLAERSADVGIHFRHNSGATGRLHYPEIMGAGVILFDHDGDGDLDIYFLQGNYLTGKPHAPSLSNALYRNDSAGGAVRFTDVTREAGVEDSGYGQGGEAADFDGDGDVDLYVSNLGRDVLFRNNGNGTFTKAALPSAQGWGQSCAALDYDRDGDLDLYVARYLTYDPRTETPGRSLVGGKLVDDYKGPQVFRGMASLMLRNDGGLSFKDVTREVGLYRPDGKGMGLACVDFNGDGAVDIFLSNDSTENFLFVNHDGKFEEDGLLAGVAVGTNGNRESSMGVDVADVNGDGRPDLMVPCVCGEVHTLYRNEWPWFSIVSVPCGLHVSTRDRTGFSPSFLDVDNDGDDDLFISCGEVRLRQGFAGEGLTFQQRYGRKPLLLENDGKGKFVSVGASAGEYFQHRVVGRGTAAGDLDNDGDIDLVVNHGDAAPAVLINETAGGHWVTLHLVGRGMNRDAIGAVVMAEAAGKKQYRWVRGGGSYLSVSDRRVHFGLGAAAAADRIEIAWPSGAKQVLENVAADRFIEIREPAGR